MFISTFQQDFPKTPFLRLAYSVIQIFHPVHGISISQPVGLFPGKYSVAMVKGDCSLTISNVDLKIDDGEWECQVSKTLDKIFPNSHNIS